MILEDDCLSILLVFMNTLSSHKVIKKIGYFYFGFFVIMVTWNMSVTAINNQWYLLLGTQYVAFASGIFMTFSSYTTMYLPGSVKAFENIYNETFPTFWPLRSLGENNVIYFQKLAKLTKLLLIVITIVSLTAATAGLPWTGDHYDVLFPIKIAMDYLDKRLLNLFLIIFYSWFYHIALTILGDLFSFVYLVLHLYMQLHMLNLKLKKIGSNSESEQELVACVQLHQTLLRFSRQINEIFYYRIFYYTASGVILALSLILVQKTQISKLELFVTRCAALSTVFVALAFCWVGQLIENESDKLLNSAYGTPWYLWSIKSRKLNLILLSSTQKNIVLSSSGVITINYKLLIKLFRAIHSTVMFLMNISSFRKPENF